MHYEWKKPKAHTFFDNEGGNTASVNSIPHVVAVENDRGCQNQNIF